MRVEGVCMVSLPLLSDGCGVGCTERRSEAAVFSTQWSV